MRVRSLVSGLASVLLLSLAACPGDDTSGTGGTETSTGTGTGTETTEAVDSTADESTGDTTGEPAGVQLVPCDPNDEASCEEGVCSGHPMSGFYCRPGCSSMAEPGTPCGADDVCLPVRPGATQTACFDVRTCDVVTGDGCSLAAGDACVVIGLDPERTACVPVGTAGAGEDCAPAGMLECGPGMGCVGSDLDAGLPGICTGWCVLEAALPDGCPACAPLGQTLGICSECTVLDDPCPAGSQCQLANELLGGVCIDTGPGGPGSPCAPLEPAQSCQDGLLCVDLDAGGETPPLCLVPCDPQSPTCTGEGESCLDLSVLMPGAPADQLGVCINAGVLLCDPTAMPPTGCLPGDNCLDIGGGLGICGSTCDPALGDGACMPNAACFPSDGTQLNAAPFVEGNGACGLPCTTDVDCGGATCLHLDGLDAAGLCGATCVPGMAGTCPGGQTCVATPEDPMVGACMTGGTTCNPQNLGSCGLGGACIPMEGEMLVGICQPACFAQDPNACGGMPALCQGKSDPIWHEGTCIGGGPACDLIEDDCGPGRACGVIGGQAFGGQAFLCDDAGPLGEGGDCSMDDSLCGAGVGCIDGVCRVWCDPLAGACVTGTCTDLSAGLYLPAGTIGACL
ncbi:hypothetical protein [Paraliomyxa miuraensis]|uniref:hypothetical protein n=1 Tax=Paraliomyxa miuraensis TaxID=376150 RepID=UPI00225A0114|nr:hypothetical protein [Paraliomyxa miuraensis]MCX4245077.1 hypothetical protein [Paraliomyxa miuraensis]